MKHCTTTAPSTLLFAGAMALMLAAPPASRAQTYRIISSPVRVASPPTWQGERDITLPAMTFHTTSTLPLRLMQLNQISQQYSELFFFQEQYQIQPALTQMQTRAGDILSTPVVALLISKYETSAESGGTTPTVRIDQGKSRSAHPIEELSGQEAEDAARDLLLACALAVMDQATSAPELRHWRSWPDRGQAEKLYRGAGMILAGVLDALPTPAARQKIVGAAPAALRGRFVMLEALNSIYRDEAPSAAPPPHGEFDLPPPKIEPRWQSLLRRVQAFQGVMPPEVLAGMQSAKLPSTFNSAIWVFRRQWNGLKWEERHSILALFSITPIQLDFILTAPGQSAMRRLIMYGVLKERYPLIIPTVAAWDILTEDPGFTREIALRRGAARGLIMEWTPPGGLIFPLKVDSTSMVSFDFSEILPFMTDKTLERDYLKFFVNSPNHLGQINPLGQSIRGSENLPEHALESKRLNLAPWLEEGIAPQLKAAGLTPDHPQWAAKRDMLMQPFIQMLARGYIEGQADVNMRDPDDKAAWLTDQLMKDYAASQTYQAEIKEWHMRFNERAKTVWIEWWIARFRGEERTSGTYWWNDRFREYLQTQWNSDLLGPCEELCRTIYLMQAHLEKAVAEGMEGLLAAPAP